MNDTQKSKLHPAFFIRGIPHLFFVLLLFAIIANLTSLWPLRTQSYATGYRGILKKIRIGVVSDHKIIIHRRGLYLALSQKAPGINLILPNGCSLDKAQLYGLGRVERIQYRDYDPEKLLAEFDFSSHISVRLYTDRRLGPGPFAIATGKKQPETMIVLKRDDMWHLVDISLLPVDIYL